MEDLKNRRVLVTGASTGIGRAVAEAFAARGAVVAIHYNRHAEEAETLRAAIEKSGGRAIPVRGDLSKPGEATKVVSEAVRQLGGLDVLVNNAGALVRRSPFAEIPSDLVDEIFNLNVRSVIEACQAALPELEKSGEGAIINVGSIAGADGGGSGSALYSGSKAFVHNLTRHLARDLGPKGIRVNGVAPGVIATPFHAATPPERMEAMRKATVLGRVGTPEDCVGVFLFLAAPSMSRYITGQVIHVNGGQLMA